MTNRRIMVFTKFMWSNKTETINVSDVQDVSVHTHELASHRIELQGVGSRMTIEIPRNKSAATEIAHTIRHHAQSAHQAAQAQTSPAQPSAQPSLVLQLRELADLHQAGALTDEEFAAAKASLIK